MFNSAAGDNFSDHSSLENQIQPTSSSWCYFFNKNNSWYNLIGLGISNFVWRMLELTLSEVQRGKGIPAIEAASYKLALATACARIIFEFAKNRHLFLKGNQFQYYQFINTGLYGFLHFDIAYMGWDVCFELGYLINVSNALADLSKNACFSGVGYVVGEVIAQTSILGLDRLGHKLGLLEDDHHLIDNVYGNASVYVEPTAYHGSDDGDQESNDKTTESPQKPARDYYTKFWLYTKSFILFFMFTFISNKLESRIDDPDNRDVTALGQALFVGVALMSLDLLMTSLKTTYDYYAQPTGQQNNQQKDEEGLRSKLLSVDLCNTPRRRQSSFDSNDLEAGGDKKIDIFHSKRENDKQKDEQGLTSKLFNERQPSSFANNDFFRDTYAENRSYSMS